MCPRRSMNNDSNRPHTVAPTAAPIDKVCSFAYDVTISSIQLCDDDDDDDDDADE